MNDIQQFHNTDSVFGQTNEVFQKNDSEVTMVEKYVSVNNHFYLYILFE